MEWFTNNDGRKESLPMDVTEKLSSSLKCLANIWIGECDTPATHGIIANMKSLTNITLGKYEIGRYKSLGKETIEALSQNRKLQCLVLISNIWVIEISKTVRT